MTEGMPNWENRTLFHGDNLDFLRGMNSDTVHLIATDPPFKKGRDFYITSDDLKSAKRGFKDRWRWDADVHEEWVDQIQDDWSATWAVIEAARRAYGDDMAAFLCWLGVRLMEMHRVLREDGSIYLHIDHTAHAYVKALMDSVFGWRNFLNEIVWSYNSGGGSKKHFGRKHDILLLYAKKAGDQCFNADEVRVPYDAVIAKSRENLFHPEGKVSGDVWKIKRLPNHSKKLLYPTQKPLDLYTKAIVASTKKGDVVLDPFCGCATTLVAAEQLERQWLGMDIWDGALETVIKRLEQQGLLISSIESTDNRFITFGDVKYTSEPLLRTDENEIAAPALKLRTQRPVEPWQKLTHNTIRNILIDAQKSDEGKVWCAGCGRNLEKEFMELDHILPRSDRGDNFITNRVLLCRPCNSRKGNVLTMKGLHKENKKAEWMVNETRANDALDQARSLAEQVRDDWGTSEVDDLVSIHS